MSLVRFQGALRTLAAADRAALIDRRFSLDASLTPQVETLIAEVKTSGDAALRRMAEAFDRVRLESLEVPRAEWERALAALDPAVRRGLERAVRNLTTVARAGLPRPQELEVEPGLFVGRRADPLGRVGVYAPGGTAAYPSSVLMGVVPAKAAGVKEVVLCSPPGPSGRPSDVVLAAAALAGVDRVFALGGAGAIAALTFGTESVPAVDRIVGPGNAWVAEAKRQVAGVVGIDAPAGPSEILIVADETTRAEVIARELLAQAEHDADACVVALVTKSSLAAQVVAFLEQAVGEAPRRDKIEPALRSRGAVLTIDSLDEAWPFIEAFAPEHLLLAFRDAQQGVARVRNAGTIFVGERTSVAFGDYLTGANHVLPTAGAGRRFSGLSVLDFVRWQTWQRVTPEAAASLAVDTVPLAKSEGLFAHADSAAQWLTPGAPEVRSVVPLRAQLETVSRYSPTRPPCAIDLTDNTNRFGAPPAATQALARLERVGRYPTPWSDELRAALTRRYGLPADGVVVGCGSDDLLDATVRGFCDPGDVLAWCPPSFGIVPTFATMNGVKTVAVPIDVDALLAANPRLIYLCAPNNPTGAVLPDGFLERLLARTSAVVVLDEAYIEFAAIPSRVVDATRSDRLLVLRTFSKAAGLSGLRVGWLAGPPRLVGEVEKARGPYKVNALAEQAAIASLTDDVAWIERCVAETKELRAWFSQQLATRGFRPLPSEANFVLVPAPNAEAVATRMRERGVSVRAFPALSGIGDALRITIAPREQLDACLAALEEATR